MSAPPPSAPHGGTSHLTKWFSFGTPSSTHQGPSSKAASPINPPSPISPPPQQECTPSAVAVSDVENASLSEEQASKEVMVMREEDLGEDQRAQSLIDFRARLQAELEAIKNQPFASGSPDPMEAPLQSAAHRAVVTRTPTGLPPTSPPTAGMHTLSLEPAVRLPVSKSPSIPTTNSQQQQPSSSSHAHSGPTDPLASNVSEMLARRRARRQAEAAAGSSGSASSADAAILEQITLDIPPPPAAIESPRLSIQNDLERRRSVSSSKSSTVSAPPDPAIEFPNISEDILCVWGSRRLKRVDVEFLTTVEAHAEWMFPLENFRVRKVVTSTERDFLFDNWQVRAPDWVEGIHYRRVAEVKKKEKREARMLEVKKDLKDLKRKRMQEEDEAGGSSGDSASKRLRTPLFFPSEEEDNETAETDAGPTSPQRHSPSVEPDPFVGEEQEDLAEVKEDDSDGGFEVVAIRGPDPIVNAGCKFTRVWVETEIKRLRKAMIRNGLEEGAKDIQWELNKKMKRDGIWNLELIVYRAAQEVGQLLTEVEGDVIRHSLRKAVLRYSQSILEDDLFLLQLGDQMYSTGKVKEDDISLEALRLRWHDVERDKVINSKVKDYSLMFAE